MIDAGSRPGLFEVNRTPYGVSYGQPAAAEDETDERNQHDLQGFRCDQKGCARGWAAGAG